MQLNSGSRLANTSRDTTFSQYTVDNFKLNISSQNGLKCTHALGMIFVETSYNIQNEAEKHSSEKIKRIKIQEIKHGFGETCLTYYN